MSAAKCKYFGGVIPLGYKVNGEKSFVLDEEIAPIVKTVFEMFVAGSNYADLIRYLNGRGVKTTKGGEFNKNRFQRILSNRRYLGKRNKNLRYMPPRPQEARQKSSTFYQKN